MRTRTHIIHSLQRVFILNVFILLICTLLAQSAAINSTTTSTSTELPSTSSTTASSSEDAPSSTPSSPSPLPDSQPVPSFDSSALASGVTPNWVPDAKPKTWKARKWPIQSPTVSSEGGAYFPLYPPYTPQVVENEAEPDTDDTAPGSADTDDADPDVTGEEATGEDEEAEDDKEAQDDSPQPTIIPNIECPEKTGVQSYAHPEECDQFYLCTNGTLTLEQCQNGLLFKGGPGSVHNHCHYHWDVECNERKKEMVALSTESCEHQFGMYPEKEMDGCSNKYVVCEFGRAQMTECVAGLAYDPRIHRCNWPDEMMDLKCKPKNIVGFECPDGMPEDPVSARFWPYPRFALKGDCQKLITCVNGHPRLITCDADMVVDDSTLTCEEPELVPNCAHLAKQEEKQEDA